MDPIRAIAPILALASFALVAARGLLMQSGAANTLKDALIAMFLGLIAGTICAAIVRSVVDEHNKEYARANPVRPIGWVEPDQQITCLLYTSDAADE